MSKELPSRINNFFHFTTLNGLSNILSTRCIAAVSHLADDSKGERVERDKLEKEFGNLIPKAEFESFDLAQLVPEAQSFFRKGYDTVIGQLADRLRNFPVCFTQFASMRFLAHFGNFAVEVKDPPHLKPVVYKS